jgi:hypothetical protein
MQAPSVVTSTAAAIQDSAGRRRKQIEQTQVSLVLVDKCTFIHRFPPDFDQDLGHSGSPGSASGFTGHKSQPSTTP